MDVGKTLKVMSDAGICRLPYKDVLIEFELSNNSPIHEMVHFTEIGDNIVSVKYFLLDKATNSCAMTNQEITINVYDEGFIITGLAKDSDFDKVIYSATMIALQMALLLINMRGIERERHEFTALNKQRVKKNKPTISPYTYLRIGHVYSSDGTKSEYTSGLHRTMHVRAGHVRNQRYGPKFSESRVVYIPPTIVNFVEGETLTTKPKIIKA